MVVWYCSIIVIFGKFHFTGEGRGRVTLAYHRRSGKDSRGYWTQWTRSVGQAKVKNALWIKFLRSRHVQYNIKIWLLFYFFSRPDASFMWFLNPFKSIRYIIWHNYKWKILKGIIVLAIFLMIILFFYSIPGYSVKKMLGA